jgi:hypothetical protein
VVNVTIWLSQDDDVVVVVRAAAFIRSRNLLLGEPMNASDVPWARSIRTAVRWDPGHLVRRNATERISIL